MKSSFRKHHSLPMYQTYESLLGYFREHYFARADAFVQHFGDYIEKKTACDQIVIDNFLGYSNKFGISIKKKGERVLWVEVKANDHGMLIVESISGQDKGPLEKYAADYVRKYFDKLNEAVFNGLKQDCDVKETNDVQIDAYEDYQFKKTITLTGSMEKIIDDFVTHNDRMRYINGSYWKFSDKNWETLYYAFLAKYKGNYFLDNAVRRGCIID